MGVGLEETIHSRADPLNGKGCEMGLIPFRLGHDPDVGTGGT